jgi:hypothetical protein
VACLQAGAAEAVDGTGRSFGPLAKAFDATLNFAAWEDDLALVRCLREGALGHATTVHPLLHNFDELGWLRGALKTASDKRRHAAALPKGTQRYAWTTFRPESEALIELRRLVEQRRIDLPVARRVPMAAAAQAFDHVRGRRRGRAGSGGQPTWPSLCQRICGSE